MSTYNTIAQEVKAAGIVLKGHEFKTHQGFYMIDLYIFIKDLQKLKQFYRQFFFIESF